CSPPRCLPGRRVGPLRYPRQLHLPWLHAHGPHSEDPRRQPRPQEEVDLPHPPGQDGPAQGPHGSRHLPALRCLAVRHRRRPPRRRR
ncbi:hypothetical protein BN1708_020607, partial [Verticillium longisporum]